MPSNKLFTLDKLNTGIWTKLKSLAPITNATYMSDQIPLWIDGENVFFNQKGIAAMGNEVILQSSSLLEDPLGIIVAERIVDGSLSTFVYSGGLTKLVRSPIAGAVIDVTGTPYTGSLNDFWSIVDFGNFVFATNDKDEPQVLTDAVGSNNFANLAADFSTAKIFVRRGPHMLAFNTSINDKGFVWASSSDPKDWTPTSENDAGDLIIRELESEIMAAAPLGDRIAVYGLDSVYLVSFIAGELTFGYKPAVKGIGASTIHSVVPVGKTHFGISSGRAWQFDGANVEFIDEPAIKDWLKQVVGQKLFGYHHQAKNVVVWHFSEVGQGATPTAGIMYDYVQKLWTPLNFGRTAGFSSGIFDRPVVGTSTRLNLDFSTTDFRKGILISKPLDLGDPDHIKFIDSARVSYTNIDGTASVVRIAIGTQDDTDDAISFTSLTSVSPGNPFVEFRVAGRYITIKIESTLSTPDDWELFKIELYGQVEGEQ